jgi:lysophospholipase L1-like esterase
LDELLELKPDYVLIQFGHNDQKRYNLDAYSANLKSYVDRIRKAGGKPVIVSSVTRRTFGENGEIISQLVKSEKYTFKGNLTEFAQAAHTVARDLNLPFIDLHTRSIEHHNKIGQEESMTYNFVENDKTHFSKKGAEAITDLIIEEMKTAVPELSGYLK